MMTLYNIPLSGNCHKVRMLLSFLGIPYQKYDIDMANNEQKSPEYLKINPFGQAPVLDDNGIIIRDSQAILVYLAKQYGKADWWPDDPVEIANIVSWLSTAANELAQGPNKLRLHYKFGRAIDLSLANEVTDNLLTILNTHLADKDWLVGEKISIADIALYPYIALSHEGKVELMNYENILSWLFRIETLPNYLSMPGLSN